MFMIVVFQLSKLFSCIFYAFSPLAFSICILLFHNYRSFVERELFAQILSPESQSAGSAEQPTLPKSKSAAEIRENESSETLTAESSHQEPEGSETSSKKELLQTQGK